MKKEMKGKPYVKKISNVAGFDVWIVNGSYVRANIDEEFTNFAQPLRFKFIPKNEFWIDKQHGNQESEFYIKHMLAENRLMALGLSYAEAEDRASLVEKKERAKSCFFRKNYPLKKRHDLKILKKVHERLLKKYSKGISVWVVDGELVRDLFFIDFTEGGHDRVYPFVPSNEVWLDNDLSARELKFVLLHEIHERNLMATGMAYEPAHRDSSAIEYYCRHHKDKVDKFLEKEYKIIRDSI